MKRDWMQWLSGRMGHVKTLKALSFYPPYLGAGIRVLDADEAGTRCTVELGLTPLNRNFFGTQFGGSLYSMCDPFLLFLMLRQLGPEYVVWDKAASIDFLRPGRGPVRAQFELPPSRVSEVRAQADAGEKVQPEFEVWVRDRNGNDIAHVTKRLYVRRRKENERQGASP